MMLHEMDASRSSSISSDFFENENQKSFNISAEWIKKIDLLEGAFKSFKAKFTSLRQVNLYLTNDNEELHKKIKNSHQN